MDIDRAGRRLRGSDADAESTRAYYARQLMQPEWLIEAPPDLADEWCACPFSPLTPCCDRPAAVATNLLTQCPCTAGRYVLPRPEGQRCLVVAGEGRTVSRTRAGRLLHTFPSALPGGARGGADAAGGPCILDCVFHEPAGAYYVQDLMCWKGYALYDCSAEFRLFWLATKLGESGAGAPPGPRHRFPFVPVAAYACDPGAPPVPAQAHPLPLQSRGRLLLWRRASAALPTAPVSNARRAAARAGGLHAALRGAVPFVRDGIALLHKEGHYALGPTPLALLWKDARCSRFHLDTDAAGAVPALQPVTLQCLPGGAVGTGDERPVALGRVPDAAAQQLGERLRRAAGLPFAWTNLGALWVWLQPDAAAWGSKAGRLRVHGWRVSSQGRCSPRAPCRRSGGLGHSLCGRQAGSGPGAPAAQARAAAALCAGGWGAGHGAGRLPDQRGPAL